MFFFVNGAELKDLKSAVLCVILVTSRYKHLESVVYSSELPEFWSVDDEMTEVRSQKCLSK